MFKTDNTRRQEYLNNLKSAPVFYNTAKKALSQSASPVDTALSCVFAPALASFVLWVIKEARKDGIKRLYFLSRDGYPMYRAAVMFCQKLNIDLDCRYFFCSRFSLRIPIYHLDLNSALDFICRDSIDITLKKIVERSGISKQQQDKTLKLLNKTLSFSQDELIPRSSLSKVKKALLNCEYFIDAVKENSEKAYLPMTEYLKQSGLCDDVPCALVDSGWTGSTQKILSDTISHLGIQKKLYGYYFGLYELVSGTDKSLFHSYYFDPASDVIRKVNFNNCLFEAVFTAPHAMTTGYKLINSKSVPVFGKTGKRRLNIVKRTGEEILKYISLIPKNQLKELIEKEDMSDYDTAVEKNLSLLMTRPTLSEAKFFGNIPFSDDTPDFEHSVTAAPLTDSQLSENGFLGTVFASVNLKSRSSQSAWFEGSAVLHSMSNRRIRQRLRSHRLLKYARHLKQQAFYRKRGINR